MYLRILSKAILYNRLKVSVNYYKYLYVYVLLTINYFCLTKFQIKLLLFIYIKRNEAIIKRMNLNQFLHFIILVCPAFKAFTKFYAAYGN